MKENIVCCVELYQWNLQWNEVFDGGGKFQLGSTFLNCHSFFTHAHYTQKCVGQWCDPPPLLPILRQDWNAARYLSHLPHILLHHLWPLKVSLDNGDFLAGDKKWHGQTTCSASSLLWQPWIWFCTVCMHGIPMEVPVIWFFEREHLCTIILTRKTLCKHNINSFSLTPSFCSLILW